MKKLLCRWAPALCLLVFLLPMVSSIAFNDVTTNAWYYKYVTDMAAGGYVKGRDTTTFGPDDALTVGEFGVMISNAFYGETLATTLTEEYDTWWQPHLNAAFRRNGMTNTAAGGYYLSTQSWGKYGDAPITRYDMASMIYNLLQNNQVQTLSSTQIYAILDTIPDSISPQYAEEVATAFHYQFLKGRANGNFDGGATLTRGEAAAVLYSLVTSSLVREENVSDYTNGNTGTPNPDTDEDQDTDSGLSAFVTEVFNLTNQQRVANGLPSLVLDANLSNLAQYKVNEMVSLGYFSHTSPTFGDFSNILVNNGINFSTARENIARGQRTPAEVVTDWMNSEHHRENILAQDVGKIGIGYNSNGNYWSQLFTDPNANTDGYTGDDNVGDSGGSTPDDDTELYYLQVSFFTYDNYLNVGYDPQQYNIQVPIANLGNQLIEEIQVTLEDNTSNAFLLTSSPTAIAPGATGYVNVVPQANLSPGIYYATIAIETKQLTTIRQKLTIEVASDDSFVPEPDPEDDRDPDLVLSNRYESIFTGPNSTGVSISSFQQSEWYQTTYGETRAVITLNQTMPEGVELDYVQVLSHNVSVTGTLEQDKSQITLTFVGLPYTGEEVALNIVFKNGYRAVLQPASIGLTVQLNGATIGPEQSSPYPLAVGDEIELIIPQANASAYKAQVTDSNGNVLSPQRESVNYPGRSSGIFVVTNKDLYLGVTANN